MGCWFQWFRMGGSVGLPAAMLIEFRQNSDVRSRVSIRTKAISYGSPLAPSSSALVASLI